MAITTSRFIHLTPLISGCMLGFSWPYTGSITPLIFIAFVPLLWYENILQQSHLSRKWLRILTGTYLCFLCFNIITTWWIYYASLPGMLMATIFNSLFMTLVFSLYYFTKQHLRQNTALICLIFYWLGFEWLHFNWELSWPWLTLGNVFSIRPQWIQWYEYTGVMGGSLWILLINIFIYQGITKLSSLRATWIKVATTIVIPAGFSFYLLNRLSIQTGPSINVCIVQPNVDPYNEKFDHMSDLEQVKKFVMLAKQCINDSTYLLVGPETALPSAYDDNQIKSSEEFNELYALLKQFPQCKILTGLTYYKIYTHENEFLPTTRIERDENGNFLAYDYFNSAIFLQYNQTFQIYHKSKLVLGVEKMPFAGIFPWLDQLALNLGGTTGSLGYQKEPSLMESSVKGVPLRIGTGICYESIYGEYMGKMARQGANIFCIITNDGWWDDTPGYKQHLSYASLRAIEHRQDIARSANTGISAFIRKDGTIYSPTKWWKESAIHASLYLNNAPTFYSLHGDIMGRVAAFFSLLLILITLEKKYNHTRNRLSRKKPISNNHHKN